MGVTAEHESIREFLDQAKPIRLWPTPILGIVASAIVMWFSRQREFRADAGGADLASRHKMVAALRRLQQSANQLHLPEQLEAFGISGGMGGGFKRLFMSHPPLEERIEVLQRSV
jgi:heat shock protein HtpX